MLGPKSIDEYLADMSRTGVPVRAYRDSRQERREITEYLRVQADGWRCLIEQLGSSLPEMERDVRVVVLVPARFEQFRIGKMLKSLATELCLSGAATPGTEVIVLNNCFKGERFDCTRDILDDARRLYRDSHLSIHYVEYQWEVGEAYPLARGRKLLADIALWRHLQRKAAPGPLYLLSEDADTSLVESRRTERMVERLDSIPTLDMVCGIRDLDRRALGHNHLLWLERRSWRLCELLMEAPALRPDVWPGASFHWNRVVSSGGNTMVTAEAYALCAGYSTDVRFGEDMDLGQRLSIMRGCWRDGRFLPNTWTTQRMGLRTEQTAARMILALIARVEPYSGDQADMFFDKDVERTVRLVDSLELLKRLTEYSSWSRGTSFRYEDQLSLRFTELLTILGSLDIVARLFDRVMHWLGFKRRDYEIDGAEIRVHSFEGFVARANAFSLHMNSLYADRRYRLGPDG